MPDLSGSRSGRPPSSSTSPGPLRGVRRTIRRERWANEPLVCGSRNPAYSGRQGGVRAQVRHHGAAGQRQGHAGEDAGPRLRPRPHQRRRHLPLARPEPDEARHQGAALHEGGAARPRRDGLRRGQGAARHPRLALRLRARRLPPQRGAGRLLPRELRHRRGDRDRPAGGGGDRAHAEPPAVLGLRPRLQPDPAAAEGGRRLRQLRRPAGDPARRHARGDPRAAAGLPREDASRSSSCCARRR